MTADGELTRYIKRKMEDAAIVVWGDVSVDRCHILRTVPQPNKPPAACAHTCGSHCGERSEGQEVRAV